MLKAYSTLDFSVHLFKVNFTMKLTYRTLPYDDDHDLQAADAEITEPGRNPGSDAHNRVQWDDDCPWSEWYSAEDPIKGTLCLGFLIIHLLLSEAVMLASVSYGVQDNMCGSSKNIVVCQLQ